MTRPTRKIKCKKCKRNVDAVIIADFKRTDNSDPSDTGVVNKYQRLLIKDHRRSIWHSRHCESSGKTFVDLVGSYGSCQVS